MTEIRFIQKDGQSVDLATVRERFFESVTGKVNSQRATHIWKVAMLGDTYARNMVEELCEIQFVRADAGFGFLQ